ncbi:Ig-like domain-containing protein [Nocardioides litoris]|uniref:Ig-like domain-containing protein n=1 Tax=Nocardioides litoris TaxID=1926648 RepID=UPI00111F0776|nr:hypothetical protein [Nocardioides litoris]
MRATPARPTARPVARPVALLASATLALAVVAPAHAAGTEEPSTPRAAPVTAPDATTLRTGAYAGGPAYVDVLANDHDPDGDSLAICRVEVPRGVPLDAVADGDPLTGQRLVLVATAHRSATYELTYWACDHDFLTPATVTVTVQAAPEVEARPAARRGRVLFHNPTRGPVVVAYGSRARPAPDARVRIPARGWRTVRTPRQRLAWTASRPRTGEVVGAGTVRGVQHRR